MIKLENHEVKLDWFDTPVFATVTNALEPYTIIGDDVHIVTIQFNTDVLSSEEIAEKITLTKDDMTGDLKNFYGFFYKERLISFEELGEYVVFLSDDDISSIRSEFADVCQPAMLKPVYLTLPTGVKVVIGFATDISRFGDELSSPSTNPYGDKMAEMLREHVHIAKFTKGLFNTMFNRFNIANMPKADEIAYTIMQGEYLKEDGTLTTMSIKDIDEFLETVKSYIRVGTPSQRG